MRVWKAFKFYTIKNPKFYSLKWQFIIAGIAMLIIWWIPWFIGLMASIPFEVTDDKAGAKVGLLTFTGVLGLIIIGWLVSHGRGGYLWRDTDVATCPVCSRAGTGAVILTDFDNTFCIKHTFRYKQIKKLERAVDMSGPQLKDELWQGTIWPMKNYSKKY